MLLSRKLRLCVVGNPLFTCSFRPRRDLHRLDHALELSKMMSPPKIDVSDSAVIDQCPRPREVAPPPPVTIKRVDAVGHLDSRIE
jgi:hypothetical protein